MSDEFWSFFLPVLFAAGIGFVGYAVSDDPALRYVGLGLGSAAAAAAVISVYLVIREELERRRERRKYYRNRLDERLNDLEVWREETAPEIQFTKDRIANLEQRGEPMGEYELASLWPILIGLVVSALFFLIKSKGAKK